MIHQMVTIKVTKEDRGRETTEDEINLRHLHHHHHHYSLHLVTRRKRRNRQIKDNRRRAIKQRERRTKLRQTQRLPVAKRLDACHRRRSLHRKNKGKKRLPCLILLVWTILRGKGSTVNLSGCHERCSSAERPR